MNKSSQNIKNWDRTTIILLILSFILILFSFCAPFIFTLGAKYSSLNFTETGAIGDMLGGIMNPFIAVGGILLTFLAFYMQIKANQIQITQFNQGIENEKKITLREEKKSSYYNLSLLNIDLTEIVSDINQKTERIKEYLDLEKQDNLNTNYLYRTPSKRYTRILETDRIQIYKGYLFFISQEEKWLENYSKLYNVLEFLPELFSTIYSMQENHSRDIFEKKMILRDELNTLMDQSSALINNHHADDPANYLTHPEVKICNTLIGDYYLNLQENLDENLNPKSETDFNIINNEILEPFLSNALFVRNNVPNFDRTIEVLLEKISNIRKDIQLIKQRKLEFSNSIEREYNTLVTNTEEKQSLISELERIQNQIRFTLDKIQVQNL